jgi:hypothetical protein
LILKLARLRRHPVETQPGSKVDLVLVVAQLRMRVIGNRGDCVYVSACSFSIHRIPRHNDLRVVSRPTGV